MLLILLISLFPDYYCRTLDINVGVDLHTRVRGGTPNVGDDGAICGLYCGETGLSVGVNFLAVYDIWHLDPCMAASGYPNKLHPVSISKWGGEIFRSDQLNHN